MDLLHNILSNCSSNLFIEGRLSWGRNDHIQLLLIEDVIFNCSWLKLIVSNYSWFKINICKQCNRLLLAETSYSTALGWKQMCANTISNYSWLKTNYENNVSNNSWLKPLHSYSPGWNCCIHILLDERKFVRDVQMTLWGINTQKACWRCGKNT